MSYTGTSVTILNCPTCGKTIMNDCAPRIDDAGTKWFKCESCGNETAAPKKRVISAAIKSDYYKEEKEPFNPNSYAKNLMENFFFKN